MPTQYVRRAGLCLILAAALMIPCGIGFAQRLPDEIQLTAGSSRKLNLAAATVFSLNDSVATIQSGDTPVLTAIADGETELSVKWLNLLPMGNVKVTVSPQRTLIPGGQNVGVALRCDGVVVVGTSDPSGAQSPARLAGIKSGDVIAQVNGEAVSSADQFTRLISTGEAVRLTIERDGQTKEIGLQPVRDEREGEYRIGAWVRDSTAGVGTLTFIDPETGRFGALGHAIQDVDTLTTLPVADGSIYESDVVGILPGLVGAPGEIMGSFFEKNHALGDITANTPYGIFGQFTGEADTSAALPAGDRSTTHTGAAQILTTLDDGVTRAYDVEITRLYPQDEPAIRSMVIEVTDEELLAKTGGIVQGMSGSPIIQDGQIVGAVTHVFLNDPTRGYGVYIDWMLDQSDAPTERAA
ncbi:MAG: SpoIVB peptidase [Clostridia bacterium]|nr:SpoIVB peptidase [Clostridia bacterium]